MMEKKVKKKKNREDMTEERCKRIEETGYKRWEDVFR